MYPRGSHTGKSRQIRQVRTGVIKRGGACLQVQQVINWDTSLTWGWMDHLTDPFSSKSRLDHPLTLGTCQPTAVEHSAAILRPPEQRIGTGTVRVCRY
jgi:hypothetical protein